MFDSEILEIAIGLVFILLIASLIATTVRETIEAFLKTRAIQMERGLRQLLDDPDGTGITKELFDHPLLYGLFAGEYDPGRLRKCFIPRAAQVTTNASGQAVETPSKRIIFGSNLPAYVPSRNFALALLHLVSGSGSESSGVLNLESVKANALTLPEGRLKQAVLVAVGEAGNDIDRARTSLEAWFDSNMDRVSGWYKRETQWILLALGLFIAVALNIDTLGIVRELSVNNTVRQRLVTQAQSDFEKLEPGKVSDDQLKQEVSSLSDLIGWSRVSREVRADFCGQKEDTAAKAACEAAPQPFRLWALHVAGLLPGWLIAAIAISLGAPFWFDILNKFMVIRSTVKPYEKSPAEGSEDRQGGGSSADRLAPAPQFGAGQQWGGSTQLPSSDQKVTSNMSGAGTADFRFAVDLESIDPGSLKVTRNNKDVEFLSDGFVELPLEAGVIHQINAKATRNSQPVTWNKTIMPTLDDDGDPVAIKL